ncbi:hypothetical protein BZA05DRAFT_476711 [Tricharina praecox]|uniref:uncharacterized protein n=1 Tax=Tricharina praecox TaxID=43433 RepID=UPI002220F573|nr:uncharacterized protein BZA05DRAFT_476711 [Tricharina praecox]KAI5844677.1 hypothetical protein BZA05DRAFT_476711 [Tricharina praecox]
MSTDPTTNNTTTTQNYTTNKKITICTPVVNQGTVNDSPHSSEAAAGHCRYSSHGNLQLGYVLSHTSERRTAGVFEWKSKMHTPDFVYEPTTTATLSVMVATLEPTAIPSVFYTPAAELAGTTHSVLSHTFAPNGGISEYRPPPRPPNLIHFPEGASGDETDPERKKQNISKSYRFAEMIVAITFGGSIFVAGVLWAAISFFIPFRESVVCGHNCGCEVNEDGEVIHRNFHLPDTVDEVAPYRKVYEWIIRQWKSLFSGGSKGDAESDVDVNRNRRVQDDAVDHRPDSQSNGDSDLIAPPRPNAARILQGEGLLTLPRPSSYDSGLPHYMRSPPLHESWPYLSGPVEAGEDRNISYTDPREADESREGRVTSNQTTHKGHSGSIAHDLLTFDENRKGQNSESQQEDELRSLHRRSGTVLSGESDVGAAPQGDEPLPPMTSRCPTPTRAPSASSGSPPDAIV